MNRYESLYEQAIELAQKMAVSKRQELIDALGKMNTTKYGLQHYESTIEILVNKINKQKDHIATNKGSKYGYDQFGYSGTPVNTDVTVNLKSSGGSKTNSEYTISIEARSEPYACGEEIKEVVYLLVYVMGGDNTLPVDQHEVLVSNFSGKPKDISEWVASIIYTLFIRFRDADRSIALMKTSLYEIDQA